MKLYYFRTKNFGDALNPYLWPRLLPGVLDDDPSTLFVGIGTLLNDNVPVEPRKVVFGSGAGYGRALPNVHDGRWDVVCVRGPRTAEALGLPADRAAMDPAVLLRLLHEVVPERERHGIALMPHIRSEVRGAWPAVAERLGWTYVSPVGEVEAVLRQIASARLLVTEALHGAIVAAAFRVPFVLFRSGSHILTSKWDDWGATAAMPYAPRPVETLVHPRWVAKHVRQRVPVLPEALAAGLPRLALGGTLERRIERNARALAALAAQGRSDQSAVFAAVESGVRRLEGLLDGVRAGVPTT